MVRPTTLRAFKAHKSGCSSSLIDIFLKIYQKCVPTLACVYARDYVQMANLATATLRLFPGITAATVRAFLSPPVQGVVLETFGAGNAPQRTDLMEALKEACDRGVVIVATSQCAKGSVSNAYETGRALQAVGVASGGDMTTEVCGKLSMGLSNATVIVRSGKIGIPVIKDRQTYFI